MSPVFCDITVSVDGFVAGPAPTLERPLGEGGELLHEWAFALRSFRERHGMEGGEENADSELVEANQARTGAAVMGRRMFSGGEGPWEEDPNAAGWWGDEPPFHVPVFVLTHHAREPLVLKGGTSFTFVTEGLDAALTLAREAAGDLDVHIAGGADVVQQTLAAGALDELQLHVAPVLLGAGTRLFGTFAGGPRAIEWTRVIGSPAVTHLTYSVRREPRHTRAD